MPDSSMVAIVSHDAGGAEILSSYVAQQDMDCIYCLAGPAIRIFERKLGPINVLPLEEAIKMAKSLLCGTGSDFEFHAIKTARQKGMRTIAFLDHWVNYRERFMRRGETCLPDEIWVGDTVAEARAKTAFPRIKIRFVENPYFAELKSKLAAIPKPNVARKAGASVLFVGEALREREMLDHGDKPYFGYREADGLRYFLSHLEAVGQSVERLVIRPHPLEQPNKYDEFRQETGPSVVIGGDKTLLEEIIESDVVVGFQSMALVVGLLAGKRVISCIPPGGKACGLPQPEIEHLQLLCQTGSQK